MNEGALFKEFEEKFGFKCYEDLKTIMSRQHMKIEGLKKSRDKWKEKYQNLKNQN